MNENCSRIGPPKTLRRKNDLQIRVQHEKLAKGPSAKFPTKIPEQKKPLRARNNCFVDAKRNGENQMKKVKAQAKSEET